MGVIFLKSESHQFISACQSNIQKGLDVIQDLKSGSTHLMQAIDGRTLTGAAYTAGKGLFGELIVPVITRFGQAIEEMQADLRCYKSADQAVQAASTNKLDEDKLTQQIRECEAYRQTVKMTADALNSQAFEILAMSNPVTAMVALADQLFDIRGKLNAYLTSLDQDIEKLKYDLRLLNNFVSQTQGLFRDSTSRIKLAMQGISVLGKMTVNADGTYRFPNGMDKSWFSQLQKNATAVEDSTLSNAYLALHKQIEDLLSPLKKGKTDNIKRIEMLLKTYPANVVKKLLGNDEFWILANKLPSGIQTKLINGLSKYETFGQAIAQGKWLPKMDTLGKAYESFGKFSSPVKTFVSESLKNAKWLKGAKEFGVTKGLGSIAKVATYAQLGITFVSSGIDEYGKTGSIGKGIIGGGIETLKSIGPLEGMTIGAAIGTAIPIPMVSTAVGAGIGGLIGLVNVGRQFANPYLYDDIKDGGYKLYDKGKVFIGKAISQRVDTVKHVYKDVQNVGKSIGKVIPSIKIPKVKWG